MPTVIIPEDRVPALNRSIEQGFVKGGPPGQEGYIAGIEGTSPPSIPESAKRDLMLFSLPPSALPERTSASVVGPRVPKGTCPESIQIQLARCCSKARRPLHLDAAASVDVQRGPHAVSSVRQHGSGSGCCEGGLSGDAQVQAVRADYRLDP